MSEVLNGKTVGGLYRKRPDNTFEQRIAFPCAEDTIERDDFLAVFHSSAAADLFSDQFAETTCTYAVIASSIASRRKFNYWSSNEL